MNIIGRIKDIGRTLNGSFTITIESTNVDTAEAMELSMLDGLDVEIKKRRKKRSLDANAKKWELRRSHRRNWKG